MKLLLGKGYSIDGYEERVFHLHEIPWELGLRYFRDYLIAHPDVGGGEYGKLEGKYTLERFEREKYGDCRRKAQRLFGSETEVC